MIGPAGCFKAPNTGESRKTMRIELSAEALAYLAKPVKGKGGFQSALRRLQRELNGNTISLTPDEADQLVRYAAMAPTRPGGFEDRIARLLGYMRSMRRQTW